MKVKTILDHTNVYGEKLQKAKGETYDLPDDHAAALIESGIVAAAEGPAPVVDEPKTKK